MYSLSLLFLLLNFSSDYSETGKKDYVPKLYVPIFARNYLTPQPIKY